MKILVEIDDRHLEERSRDYNSAADTPAIHYDVCYVEVELTASYEEHDTQARVSAYIEPGRSGNRSGDARILKEKGDWNTQDGSLL